MTPHFILFVADQSASRTFYSAALGFDPRLDVPGMTEFELPGGSVLGLMPEVAIERLLDLKLPDSSVGRRHPRAELYLRVESPDLYLQRALDAGGTLLSPLLPRDWGHLAGYCADPDGYVLAFATE